MVEFITTSDAFHNPKFNGTSLVGYCNVPAEKLAAVAKAQGIDVLDRENYYDYEAGYDGWELHGTFNGEPFQLYVRYGVLKIGGHFADDPMTPGQPALDVDGLNAALVNL